MNIVIFEDELTNNLSPLSLLKPVFDIRTGVFSNSERINYILKKKYKIQYHCRNILSEYLSEVKFSNVYSFEQIDTLFLNGRVIFKKSLLEKIINSENEFIWLCDNTIIAAFISGKNVAKLSSILNNKETNEFLPFTELAQNSDIKIKNNEFFGFLSEKDFYVLNYVWDIVKYFEFALNYDLELMNFNYTPHENLEYKIINPKSVFISNTATILPYAVLNATQGKIFIEDEVFIEPFSYIKGPVYIAKKSIIKSGTKIYGPVSIGYNSRIAGEVSGTIFHSFVNKQHDGFIGNSYIAEFVNLGADTVTSNLKNNYSPIKARFRKDDIQHQTGLSFFGSIIGDHTKTGINTMLNTGSVIGIFSLIAGGGFPDKFIDSFCWYISGKQPTRYKIEEALQTAKIVMNRRQIELSPAYEKLIRKVYNSLIE